jgi:hypothetical protein
MSFDNICTNLSAWWEKHFSEKGCFSRFFYPGGCLDCLGEGAPWNDNFDFTFKADKQRAALFCIQFYREVGIPLSRQ